ncbi:hypothetical protein H8S90_14850 [Olivibacter sp. SDN3]|uniref:DUF6624 domain-containing protein n=1 Tax=Olivibacter sp. SDN3 TaxID=2764720 RepID=UPI0016512792|nr:DUF6624 domain-containing protein [Olivibacter sp. SDN3]QNL48085.1 hypothetical protein H8S90_14850 [Olivibacter sp. SDN3]
MKILLGILLFFWTDIISGQESIQLPLLKKQLDSMALIDKKTGQDVRYGKIEDRDSLRAIVRETYIRNTAFAKQIFQEYGYPNYDKVGKESEKNFWLCVQHSDHDISFQQDVLKEMKKEVKRKKATASNFASLTDRVNINLGKPQVYGTQVTYDESRTAVPEPIIRPKQVNKRRKSIGLEPLEDYLAFATEAHRKMNPVE